MTITTVNDIEPRSQFTANGVQVAFPCEWAVRASDDVVVVFGEGSTPNIGFTFDPSNLNTDAGFDVVFNTPPPLGTLITVYRAGELDRQTNYGQQTDFKAATVNAEFADLMLRLQELRRDLRRTVRLPVTDPTGQMVLPGRTTRATKILSFDANGTPVAVLDAVPDQGTTIVIGGGGSTYDLVYDGATDQSLALQAVLDAATGVVKLISDDGALFLASRVRVPSGVTLDTSQIIVDLGQYGELLIQGELEETPEENLYQLAATASPGATSITVDTTPQGGHTAWGEDVFGVIRGENAANGIAKQRAYFRVTSKNTGGGAAAVVLGITPPLPADQGTFAVTYPGSAWDPSVGGPTTDRSLITIATASLLTGNVARHATVIPVANGALYAAGDVCMLQDDRHATDPGSATGGLPIRQELVRVRSVSSNNVTIEKTISRDFLTSENAALFKINAATDAHIIGGVVRQVENVDAAPESRTHATLMFFADRCSVTGVRLLEDDSSYSPRGSACRVTRSLECRVADVWRIGPKSTASGDGNGVMCAYSTDTIIEHCYLERCRHGLINQGSTRTTVRHNRLHNCLINGLDDHGVYETDSYFHDNVVVGGPSFASGSTQQLAVTLGNTRWLAGSHFARVVDNQFIGFAAGSNGGVTVRQASSNALIVDNSFLGCAGGVRVTRNSRGGVLVTDSVIVRDNYFRNCPTPLSVDGGLNAWAVDVTYSGTTARPVYVLASNGREYSCVTTKLGGSEPSHTSGTTDGWLHVGTAIQGVANFEERGNDFGDGANSITATTVNGLVRDARVISDDETLDDEAVDVAVSERAIKVYVDTSIAAQSILAAGYSARRVTEDFVLDAADRAVTIVDGAVQSNATIVSATSGAVEGRVDPYAKLDEIFAVFVDPASTSTVTLGRTIEVLALAGNVTGTTVTGIDTTNVTAGQPIAVFKNTGVGEDGEPLFELISDPDTVVDTVTVININGSLEMDIAASEAATGARVQVTAGEQGLINGSTAALTLIPGTTMVRVIEKGPWTNLSVEGPSIGRFVPGTEITDDFTFDVSQRGQTIQVNKATDVVCTLNAMPIGTWARFIVRGLGDLTFTNGTATASFATGKIATVPASGSVLVEFLGETDVFLSGTLENAP